MSSAPPCFTLMEENPKLVFVAKKTTPSIRPRTLLRQAYECKDDEAKTSTSPSSPNPKPSPNLSRKPPNRMPNVFKGERRRRWRGGPPPEFPLFLDHLSAEVTATS